MITVCTATEDGSVVKNSFGSGLEKRNFDLTSAARRINFPAMSATEIINELPKLGALTAEE